MPPREAGAVVGFPYERIQPVTVRTRAPCQVLLFTGVRYERWPDHPPAHQTGQRRKRRG